MSLLASTYLEIVIDLSILHTLPLLVDFFLIKININILVNVFSIFKRPEIYFNIYGN